MVTVLDVLQGATDYLSKKGVESPRLNAEHLLASILKLRRLQLYMEFDRPLGEAEKAPMRDLIRRRGEGIPLQHLLGSVEFFGREFRCDPRALIPRPETEQLVEFTLARLPATASSVVDVGTGSGVIAITLQLERPGLSVTGTDRSADALALARENAGLLSAPIEWIETDLLPKERHFDAIVANLPYIPTSELSGLSREVKNDPLSALDGGPDGMDLLRQLIAMAPGSLNRGGLLALETGTGQPEQLVGSMPNFRDIEVVKDYQGHSRFLFARHG
ncbi:MAG: peptide chain release factor N(5)-glutamine methyltransferase [Terrimicrobiaceae bacterium]